MVVSAQLLSSKIFNFHFQTILFQLRFIVLLIASAIQLIIMLMVGTKMRVSLKIAFRKSMNPKLSVFPLQLLFYIPTRKFPMS